MQQIFSKRVANPINKRVCSTSLFIGFANPEGNISHIWKSTWINQYITFFFVEHFKFISIYFHVLKRSVLSIATITRKDTLKLNFHGRHFVLKRTRLPYWPLNRLWKRNPAFYFYSNCLSGYWSRRSEDRPLNRLWKRNPAFYFYSNCLSGYWSRRSEVHNG